MVGMPRDRHDWAPGLEDDQHNRLTSRHSPVECIDCFGNRLSGGKALLFAIPLSFKGQFSSNDVGSAWHGMTMPFQLSVWGESDFRY